MNYSEDHIALAAEYALGTLDADERALVETMMIVDHGFMDVVHAWDRKLSPLHQMVAPIEPPAYLWENIRAEIGLNGVQAEQVFEPEPVAEPQPAAAEFEPIAEPEPAAPVVESPALPVVEVQPATVTMPSPDQFDYTRIMAQPPEDPAPVAVEPDQAPRDEAVPDSIAAQEIATLETVPEQTPAERDLPAQAGSSPRADDAGPVEASDAAVEPAPAPQPSNVGPLAAGSTDRRRGSAFGWIMAAIAASLVGIVWLQANRPEQLPEALRVKPKVQTVQVPAPPSPLPAQWVAVLQQGAAVAPAFILTVNTATKNFTVRRVGAPPEPGKSYELWLVSDKLQRPRSLGVIGGSDFTIRPSLAAYDADTIRQATYAVTLEPEGGSPTGEATGPIVYAGTLIESVPALPEAPR